MCYQKPYTTMFNAATDALEELDRWNIGRAKEILRTAQVTAEEQYIESDKIGQGDTEEAG